MHVDLNRLTFFDRAGQVRSIRGCSVMALDEFRSLYSLLWQLIGAIEPEFRIDFRDAIEANPEILSLSFRLLTLCGINPEWLDTPMLAALVHSYEDTEGKPHRGYLAELNLPDKPQSKSGEGISWEEYIHNLLCVLSETEGGLLQAQAVLERLPIASLEGYLKARSDRQEKVAKDPNNRAEKMARAQEKYLQRFGSLGQFTGATVPAGVA